jgi:hypothetical protein
VERDRADDSRGKLALRRRARLTDRTPHEEAGMKHFVPVILLVGLISGCSKPKVSHPEGPLDIDWARRDQERRFRARADSARAVFTSTLVSDRELTAEVWSALTGSIAQLRDADPAFSAESIFWSPQAGRLYVSSNKLSDADVKRLREGNFHSDSALLTVLFSPDSTWAAYWEGRDAEPALIAFDLQAGRLLQLDTYPTGQSEAGMGWTKSGRLVVAISSDHVDRKRRIQALFVYDLRAMTRRSGFVSPVRFEVMR